jgi:hypothetical protein
MGMPSEHMVDQNFKNSAKMTRTGFSRRKLQKKCPAAENCFGRGLEKLQSSGSQSYKPLNDPSGVRRPIRRIFVRD